jgi:MFS family permease
VYRCASSSASTTLSMVVNSSVDQSMRGTMNGLLMTAGSLGNGAGPIVGSVLYALALTLPQGVMGPVPLDGRMVFLVGGILFVGLAWYAKHYMCEMK